MATQTERNIQYQWWPDQPVLQVALVGGIPNREAALEMADTMVQQIEQSHYQHLIVILDLSSLGQSPSAAALLGGNLPKTYKIEHMILIQAPMLLRMATAPIPQLHNKLHFVKNENEAQKKANDLLSKLPK